MFLSHFRWSLYVLLPSLSYHFCSFLASLTVMYSSRPFTRHSFPLLRLVRDNLIKYGILFSPFLSSSDPAQLSPSAFESPKMGITLLSWLLSILTAYLIEKIIIWRRVKSEKLILFFNFVNGAYNLFFPCFWVWASRANPLFKMIYLFNSVILFMKIVSYAHANRDLRKVLAGQSMIGKGDGEVDDNAKPYSTNLFTEASDLEFPYLQYPENITIQNLGYFVLVPSLTYQLNFPRSKKIRKRYVLTVLLRMVMVMALMVFTFKQYIKPVLILSDRESHLNTSQILEKILVLSIPNTYIWLLGFYFYFHLYLNLFAELTRFGDRVFYRGERVPNADIWSISLCTVFIYLDCTSLLRHYKRSFSAPHSTFTTLNGPEELINRMLSAVTITFSLFTDWWNARTIESYWRNWNIPVHCWMLRHLCRIN